MINNSCVYQSPYEQYSRFNGLKGIVLRELTDEESDPEVGPMYRLGLENGEKIDAWPEEIVDTEGKHLFCNICSADNCKVCYMSGK